MAFPLRVSCAAFGAVLFALEPASALTFTQDIAPILQARCVVCHRVGQMAPMPLTSFQEVRPWADSIRREVAARRMPPFNASGEIGRYINDPRLSEAELAQLIEWLDSDMPKGPGEDRIDTAGFEANSGWTLGEPDFIVELPKVNIPGEIGDAYLLLYGEPVFTEPVWIDTIEWRIGNAKIVHHIVPRFVDATEPVPPERVSHSMTMEVESRVKGFGAGYLPGSSTFMLPHDEAILIPAGTRVVAEMHYAAADDAQSDQTRVGFHFAEGPRRAAEPMLYIPVKQIVIEPGDPAYARVESLTLHDAVWARAFRFHMHLRGKSGRLDLRHPDGRMEELIAVPAYDFNWQHLYELKEPLLLPAGSEVVFSAVWDNSLRNPHNPNPAARVKTGSSTQDEMGGASIFVTRADADAPNLSLQAGRESDAAP